MYYLVIANAGGEHPLFTDQDRTVLDVLVQQSQAEHAEFQLRVTDQWPEVTTALREGPAAGTAPRLGMPRGASASHAAAS
jgi:hypothetical protein